MNEAWLDGLVALFRDILSGGYARLSGELRYLLRLFISINLIFAAMAWMAAYLQIFSLFVSAILKTAIYTMLYVSFVALSQMFIEYCIWGGLTAGGIASGGEMTVGEFQKPSTVMMKGFEATAPINKFIEDHTGWAQPWNYFTLQPASWAAVGIWIAFVVMSLYLVWVQILMYIVVAYVVIFIIFAPMGPLAFLAERGFGLLTSSAARLGMAALLTALAFPFVERVIGPGGSGLLTAKGNVDMYAVSWLLAGAWGILTLIWSVSSIVAGAFGSGPIFSMGNFIPGMSFLSSSMSGGGGGVGGGGGSSSGGSSGGVSAQSPAREPMMEGTAVIGRAPVGPRRG